MGETILVAEAIQTRSVCHFPHPVWLGKNLRLGSHLCGWFPLRYHACFLQPWPHARETALPLSWCVVIPLILLVPPRTRNRIALCVFPATTFSEKVQGQFSADTSSLFKWIGCCAWETQPQGKCTSVNLALSSAVCTEFDYLESRWDIRGLIKKKLVTKKSSQRGLV